MRVVPPLLPQRPFDWEPVFEALDAADTEVKASLGDEEADAAADRRDKVHPPVPAVCVSARKVEISYIDACKLAHARTHPTHRYVGR